MALLSFGVQSALPVVASSPGSTAPRHRVAFLYHRGSHQHQAPGISAVPLFSRCFQVRGNWSLANPPCQTVPRIRDLSASPDHTVFLPCSLKRLRLHTGSGVTAPEGRGAARREGECPVTVCSRLWLWRQSHLLWIIGSLTRDPERFLESVQCGDSTNNRMSKPVRNSAKKGKQVSFCPGSPSLSISFSLSL